MADHPDLETSRRGYTAFAEGDMATVGEVLSDDIVWHSPGDNILSGTHKGKEEVFGLFAKVFEKSEGTFKNEIHDMLANDDHVVALINQSATRGDTTLEGRSVHVLHVDDGKLTEFWAINDNQDAWDEFWS